MSRSVSDACRDVAASPDEFVDIAVGLADDERRLAEFHGGLRERMERSPLMDAPRFARNLEQAFRAMWRRWCDSSSSAAGP